jgi:hypothetical protein
MVVGSGGYNLQISQNNYGVFTSNGAGATYWDVPTYWTRVRQANASTFNIMLTQPTDMVTDSNGVANWSPQLFQFYSKGSSSASVVLDYSDPFGINYGAMNGLTDTSFNNAINISTKQLVIPDGGGTGGEIVAMGWGDGCPMLPHYTTVSAPNEGDIAWDFTNHWQVVYNGSSWLAPVADGTYTVGNRITPVTGNLGKITTRGGIITAIQQAT